VVTVISFLLAKSLWPIPQSTLIAIAILLGQLCVGWTNDLVDIDIDRLQNRLNKPLAQRLISPKTVAKATYCALTLCVALSLLGPLGIRGGLVHLIGVGCGITYNFYFKRTVFSPLPYVVAFAALPTSIALSKGHFAPGWTVIAGGLFGLMAHFANVLKDIEADRSAGIFGLPQILGARTSFLVAGISLILITLIFSDAIGTSVTIPITVAALVLMIFMPLKYSFQIVMLLAIIDVALLISQISL
jgi:4-hydroxybenzoate polyprenyltransferase